MSVAVALASAVPGATPVELISGTLVPGLMGSASFSTAVTPNPVWGFRCVAVTLSRTCSVGYSEDAAAPRAIGSSPLRDKRVKVVHAILAAASAPRRAPEPAPEHPGPTLRRSSTSRRPRPERLPEVTPSGRLKRP